MIQKTVGFDLRKWASYEKSIVQPYVHSLIDEALSDSGISSLDALFRGGFGRAEDFGRLLKTGSDYESAHMTVIVDNMPVKAAALYAVPLNKIGIEPWCRGLDPLYWALRGHPSDRGWNPINVLVAYRRDRMIEIPCSDAVAFRSIEPSIDAVAAIITFNLLHKDCVRKQKDRTKEEKKLEMLQRLAGFFRR